METHLADWLKGSADGIEAESILRKCVHCGFCTATCPTYQLLGDELLHPFGVHAIRQMHETVRKRRVCGEFFIGRAVKPEEAIGLRLENGDRDLPELHAAPDRAAMFVDIDIGRSIDRGGSVEAIDTLDRKRLADADTPHPTIDGGGVAPIARVDRKPCDPHPCAVSMAPGLAEQRGELSPNLLAGRVAFEHDKAGGRIVPLMTHIRTFWVVTSTGSPWWVVYLYMGNPVKRILKRGVAAFCAKRVDFRMLAIHDMDRATDEKRRGFLAKVRAAFAAL